MNLKPLLRTALCALAYAVLAPAQAQNWPSRPIHIINPYSPGGPSDAVIRVLTEGLGSELGQPFVIESKPGGGTVIGAAYVAKSAPDGYTYLLSTVAPLILQPAINPALPYDAQRDFAPVGLIASIPNLITVHPSVPINNLKQLVDYARANPGKLNYASAGAGTGPHLGAELFSRMANIKMTHVPYGGAAPAVLGVLGGQVQVSWVNITPQIAHVRAGKLRPIAIGSAQRSSLFPEVPTVIESGYAGYISESWNGLVAPAGTPKAVIAKLAEAMGKVMAAAKTKEVLNNIGALNISAGPEEFAAYIKEDEKREVPLIKSLGLTNN
ncbi:MAG: tripartite tricarboxylate transporter substrate binding protein [Betaproteobacteria bacterium]|nr:tripartite tricarboxylate transporter substrate binding protein [Betaproteobacteria bacterium]